MSKDRARPFSRKHRKYWITVTGGMLLIGAFDLVLGYCSYTKPSDVHERIVYDVPSVPGMAVPAPPPRPATGCAPAVVARIAADLPGSILVDCAPDRVAVVRRDRHIEARLTGDQITEVAETLTLPEIPAAVMRAFAVAYPRTIPAGAIKRTRRGGEPAYELAFPPGADHHVATLRGDGTVVDLK